MTFLEMILGIEERGEFVKLDKPHSIQTDKHLYVRSATGDWEQKPLPQEIEEDKFLPLVPTAVKEKKKK